VSITLQLAIATAVIAVMVGVKIVAFRMLAGQKPNCAVDVDECGTKDCIGGCGRHEKTGN